MTSLSIGDPSETISVPMISRMYKKSIHDANPFSRKTGKVTQTVAVRKMTREFYLKHYAKDAEGNFVARVTLHQMRHWYSCLGRVRLRI